MFDVFYSGIKPNLFVHEQAVDSIEQAQALSRTRYFWWINYLTDYSGFDFLFEPTPWQQEFKHTWASQWQPDSGTYLIPKSGDSGIVYHNNIVLTRLANQQNWQDITTDAFDYSWHPNATDPLLIYQFGTQWQRTGGPRYVVPGATEVKYIDHPRLNKTTQDTSWQVPDQVDVVSFDFTWHPDATDPPYNYQFGTQHQRTGGPLYVVLGATEVKYVDQLRIRTRPRAGHVYVIDHMDNNLDQIINQVNWADELVNHTVVRYFDNYLDTLRRIARQAQDEYIWIISSVCDYTNFDFSWHPEQWQADMLHVFASDSTKFGDTFFMHVPSFLERSKQIKLLDWYDLNFVGEKVPRRSLPVIQHPWDTHVVAVKHTDWPGPLAIFTTQDRFNLSDIPTVPLWREKTRTIVPLSDGASTCIIPKSSISYVKTQLYDYPYIDRTQRHMLTDNLLDIVFIDNGEPNAEENYRHLKWAAERANNIKIHRSTGVDGRVAAYKAAAELSTTPWFFAVFAKLRVDNNFDWAWQPDRLQEPKHYIFHAFNPINGLTYGHQAMIAYNKQLVLDNPGIGLDFTLDSAHEVVPILSGTAEYAHTPWMAWRTAFREVLKLKGSADVESQYRLDKWLTVAMGQPYGQYSIYGAQDAVEYYDLVGGAIEELKKSYDWAWLASYSLIKRNMVAN